MDKKTLFLASFALLGFLTGLFFLGKGITGLVLSQSCCFPPGCPEEYICDSARPTLETPGNISINWIFGFAGALIIAFTLLLVKIFSHSR